MLLLNKFWVHGLLALTVGFATFEISSWYFDSKIVGERMLCEHKLKSQQNDLANLFNEKKAETDELNRKNQERIADLDARLTAAKRVRPNTCTPIYVRTTTTSGSDTEATPGGYVLADGGVTASTLLEYARDAEQIRIDQNTCVDTLNIIYGKNGQ